jgi:hypothetical protein
MEGWPTIIVYDSTCFNDCDNTNNETNSKNVHVLKVNTALKSVV